MQQASADRADSEPDEATARAHAPAVLVVTGLLQGIVLWLLWFALREKLWPAGTPEALLPASLVAFAVPAAIYWTTDAPRGIVARWAIVLLVALLFGLIGWHQGATLVAPAGLASRSMFSTLPAASLLAALFAGTVLVHLLACARSRDDSMYFALSWHNAVATVFAFLFAGFVWLSLYAGAKLLATVRVGFLLGLLREDWFWLPTTTTALAIGFVGARRWRTMTRTVRDGWLALSAGLLPVVLAFGVLWVLALPFAGLSGAGALPASAAQLLGFVALAVYCLNAAWRDGAAPAFASAALRRALRWGWCVTIPIAGVAAWAIAQRVGEHGWSVSRIWAALAAALALAYAVGYALPSAKARWMPWVGRVNRGLAWVAALAVLALLAPGTDARRLAVADQLHRLQAGRVGQADFDVAYLRWQTGTYGPTALVRLAQGEFGAGPALAERAATELARRWPQRAAAPAVPARVEVWPSDDGAAPDPAFLALFGQPYADALEQRCRDAGRWRCAAWTQDLDGDGRHETLLLQYGPEGAGDQLLVYSQVDGTILRVGAAKVPRLERFEDWYAAVAAHRAKTVPPLWPDLEVDGLRITIVPGASQY